MTSSRRSHSTPMAQPTSTEGKETRERSHGSHRCRIPRMMSPAKNQSPVIKETHGNGSMASRPRSTASRRKDQSLLPPQTPQHAQGLRQTRSDRERPMLKRPSTVPKTSFPPFRPPTTVINIPVARDLGTRSSSEDPEIDVDPYLKIECPDETNKDEPPEIMEDNKIQSKIRWQENIVKFENLKRQLVEQQRELLEIFAKLRSSHQEMVKSGQAAYLPSCDDLKIMNVSQLAPDQLLQLCAGALEPKQASEKEIATPSIDMDVLNEIPNRIIATCEQTLDGRKEIIDWFEDIVSKKMITKTILVSKINQFKIETNEFKSLLDRNKKDYLRVLNETGEILKKNANVTITHQLRSESFASKLTEMTAINQDLRKKLRAVEQMKTTANKMKIEELERYLKDEKSKKAAMRDLLSKAEMQIKIKEEKIMTLKAECDQTKSKSLILEKTVHQLQKENEILQAGYDKKMQKLNESIDKNTKHLEEIMADRSKLLTEKTDLEKRLTELSKHYEEALLETKHEKTSIIAKIIETEKKYNDIEKEKKELESKVECLCKQLHDSELRYEEVSKKVLDLELKAGEVAEFHKEIETIRRQLTDANKELFEYKESTAKQREALKELEKSWKISVDSEEMLKNDIHYKEERILELEKQRDVLERHLQESESKTESYAIQLSNLKNQIGQLQHDFGEFENWEKLYDKIKQQNMKLREATEHSGILTATLKNMEIQLQQQMETLTEQGHLLEERDEAIKILTDKDEEQNNLIKLLRDNLEMRTQADIGRPDGTTLVLWKLGRALVWDATCVDTFAASHIQATRLQDGAADNQAQILKCPNLIVVESLQFNQQIDEKNNEIEDLKSNIETRKHQTAELEKIILTLENLNLKLSNQKRKARQTISLLEKKLKKYESYYTRNLKYSESAMENLDDLINLLEQELSNPLDKQINNEDYIIDSETLIECQKEQREYRTSRKRNPENDSDMQTQQNGPTKIVMGNYVKKTYIPADKHNGDNVDRKTAITKMESSEWKASSEVKPSAAMPKKDTITYAISRQHPRNFTYCLVPNYIRDEKKIKMFKFAGHKLQ